MSIDLDAYFDRIGYGGKASPTMENLRELHLLHPMAIPFENLSTLIGEPVKLELTALEDKLIRSGRGGYCFEQNRLFAAVLERFGFTVIPLAARVVWRQDDTTMNPRTHMILRIGIGGGEADLIADVGFGGVTLTAPLRLRTGEEQQTPHEKFRFVSDENEFVLQVHFDRKWRSMYRFDLQPQLPIDFEVLNHYVATHPQSHFLTTLMAAIPTESGRHALLDNQLATYQLGEAKAKRLLGSAGEIKAALSDLFKIRLPTCAALDGQLSRLARPVA